MFQFFVEPGQVHGEEIVITGTDVNHIKNVLRMRIGEQLRISDNEGGDFYCKIQNMEEQQILLQIIGQAEDTEPGRAGTGACKDLVSGTGGQRASGASCFIPGAPQGR